MMPGWWTIATLTIGPLISAAVALLILRINQRSAETKEEQNTRLILETAQKKAALEHEKKEDLFKKTTEDNHVALREELLELIKTQADALKQAEATRMHRDLSQDKDFAQITGILQKSTEVQQQQLAISTTIEHLKQSDQRHDRNHESVNKLIHVMQSNILQLAARHPQMPQPSAHA